MPVIADPRYTQQSIVGPSLNLPDMPDPGPSPSALDVAAAAARQATMAGSAYARWANQDPEDRAAPPPDFDALDHIDGYEQYADNFIEARTPAEVEGIKSRIREERSDREVLARAGLGGPAVEIGMNLVDPSFLVAIAVPELAIAKIGRVGRAVQAGFEGAAVAATYEAGMQATQETRTGTQSAFTIGGGALLGGLLGALARRVPPAELRPTVEAVRSEVGAAAVRGPTTLADESLAAGGEALAQVARRVPFAETDLSRIMRSESVEARTALQEFADVAPVLEKNLEGRATPTSVESLIARHEGAVADFVEEMKRLWREYRGRPLADGERRLSRTEFESEVARAARREDFSPTPEAGRAASFLRSRVFDPLKTQAQHLSLLPPDSEINLFARSYYRRMYDRAAIRARRTEWDRLLTEHYQGKGHDLGEARALAEDITRRILGTDRGLANFHIRTTVPDAGPMHDRVLDIADEVIEPFLVHDPIKVAGAYVREMAPQVEIARRFGDKDAKAAMGRIRDEYDILRARALVETPPEQLAARLDRLQTEERDVLEALTRIRDRLYGRAGALGPGSSEGQRVAADVLRGWRNFVAAGKLGMTALTGGTQDLARIVAQYGFLPTISRLAHLVGSPAFRQLSKANARRLGVAVEVALARRVQLAADGAITEGWTEKLAAVTFKASGLNHVTDLWRTLSATLIEDKILEAAGDVAAGRALAPGVRTHLASLGLDQDALRRVADQAARHGSEAEGHRMGGSMQWTDSAVAEAYDAAIVKEARTVVMQPGVADRVWWADSEIGRTLGQLKAFSLASPLKLAVTPVQLVGQHRYAEAARFVGTMMAGGYLVHVLRQLAAGREPTTDPTAAAGEAFVESGLGGVLPDMVSPFARRFGLFGESARYSDRNVTSAIGGPAVGTFTDLYDVLYNRTAHGLSAADLQAIRRLMPMQNLWWMRRMINALEGETAEALGLPGATSQGFGERMAETVPLAATARRGGTGTGQLQQ